MKKWSIFGASFVVLVVAVLAASLLPAMSQGGGERLVLCEKNGKHDYEKNVDVAPEGEFGAGDTFLFSEPTYDNNGKKIGKSGGRGVVIRTLGDQDALIAFNVSVNLNGGRMEIQGLVKGSNFSKKPQFAIIGGTGRFAGAGGTVTVDERAGCGGFPKGDKLVFEIQ